MDHLSAGKSYNVYKDIQARTGGDIYIGVVGPVRTGKSTFIKRFMDLLVIPNISDVHSKERAIDELPQSAAGKTIMTTEPKFIPKEAAEIVISEDTKVNIRLVDCVGYMVEGAAGHIENEQERLVKTPWFDYEIPFTQAAELGTKKVINEHSTIGIVITTDGSFGDIPRENYEKAEEKTILELKNLGKPFLVILNSNRPYSDETILLRDKLIEKYQVSVMTVNCEQLKKEDITKVMEELLSAFPIGEVDFYLPKWAEMLEVSHPLNQDLLKQIKTMLKELHKMKDVTLDRFQTDSQYVKRIHIKNIDMKTGSVHVLIELEEAYYYEILSELIGVPIHGEYEFMATLRELAQKRKEYEKVGSACDEVRFKGYGVVTPLMEEIHIEEPEIIKNGNKYGVKIKASAPSIHMIKANIETEIAPIVGTQQQAEDLIQYIQQSTKENPNGIWEANIFGKSVQQLVEEGMKNKVNKLTDESQLKLQETIQKVINDSNGGLVCIII